MNLDALGLGCAFFSISLLAAGDLNAARAQDVVADEPRSSADSGFVTLGFENDVFFNTDRHYTSGLRGAYVSPEGGAHWGLGGLAISLPFVDDGDKIRSLHVLSQHMFTPDGITTDNPPLGSRPYAGLFQFETGITALAKDHLDILSLALGITGEPSLAQAGQITLHALLPASPRPEGWSTQVGFEVTAQLSYDRIWFLGDYESDGLQFDFQPRLGFDVGTAFVNAQVGGQLRVGNRLFKNPGAAMLAPGRAGVDWFEIPDEGETNIYAFAGVDSRWQGHNFSLEGSLFQDYDRRVPVERFVTDVSLGLAVESSLGRLSFTAVRRGREFEQQAEADWIGGLYFSFAY